MAYKKKVELHGGMVVDKYTTAPPEKGAGLAERFRYGLFVHLPTYKQTENRVLGTDYYMQSMLYASNMNVIQHGLWGNLLDYVPYVAPKYNDDPAKRFTNWLGTVIPHYFVWKLGLWDTVELTWGYGDDWPGVHNPACHEDFAHVTNPLIRALAKRMFGDAL